MSTIDQFESVFRSAVKAAYRHDDVSMRYVVVITDLKSGAALAFRKQGGYLLEATNIERFARVALPFDPVQIALATIYLFLFLY